MTGRFTVVRVTGGEVAVQHARSAAPPVWAVFRRDPSGRWVRCSVDMNAGQWLAWPATDLRVDGSESTPNRFVLQLLDEALPVVAAVSGGRSR